MADIDFGDPIGEFITERRARKALKREDAFRNRQQTARELGGLGATVADIESGRRLASGEIPVDSAGARRVTEFPGFPRSGAVGDFITGVSEAPSLRGFRKFKKSGAVVPVSPEERRQESAFQQFERPAIGTKRGRRAGSGIEGLKTSDLRGLKKDLEAKQDENPRAFSPSDSDQLRAVNEKLSGRLGAKPRKEESLFDRVKRRREEARKKRQGK